MNPKRATIYVLAVADMAGVKYDAHYNVTTVDPPELIRFIKRQYPEVEFDYPRDKDGNRISMWTLIPKKMIPPTRIARYCCAELKERGGGGRLKITGVRWSESARRKKSHGEATFTKSKAMQEIAKNEYSHIAYKLTPQGGIALPLDNRENAQMVEACYRTHTTTINPIIDWTDDEVWEFIHEYKVPYCELYDKGYKRLGCIGCPMSTNQEEELNRYPKYKHLYLLAFDKMLKGMDSTRITSWTDAESVMQWWFQTLHGSESKAETEIMELLDEQ